MDSDFPETTEKNVPFATTTAENFSSTTRDSPDSSDSPDSPDSPDSSDDDFRTFLKENFSYLRTNFREYSSITGSTGKSLKHLSKLGYDITKDDWIVTEKIHGANFSFIVRGEFLWCCKRSGLLGVDEKFFSASEIQQKYTLDAYKIHQKILAQSTDSDNIDYIQIFGEIFGGIYDGIYDGCKKTGSSVQKGVFYNPEIDFLVFDIKVVTKTLSAYKDDKGELMPISWFLSYTEVMQLLEGLTLRCVPIMAQGKMADLLKISSKFITTIPKLYNLPEVENNWAEGYVIKINSQHQGTRSRPMLKIKNEESFGEVKPHKPSNIKLIEPEQFIKDHTVVILNYCTQNRFNNLISKIGKESHRDKILGMFVADACKDYQETLEDDDLKAFNEKAKQIRDYVRIQFCGMGVFDEWMKN